MTQRANEAAVKDTVYSRFRSKYGSAFRYVIYNGKGDSIGGAYFTGPKPKKSK